MNRASYQRKVSERGVVHAEDLLVNDGRDGQAVEAVREGLPQLDVVPAFACERKSVVSESLLSGQLR